MSAMTNVQAQEHINEVRRMLDKANDRHVSDADTSYCIGALMIALDQLATVVEDLISREQGRVIQ